MSGLELFRQARDAMGTEFEIFLYAPEAGGAGELFEQAFAEVERVESNLSSFRATSELSRINREAGRGEVTTDPETFALLRLAGDYGRATGGAFDITVGSLIAVWAAARRQARRPSRLELAPALATTGWRHLQLGAARRTVLFAVPGLTLDLGAIGKGYALDRVARLLASAGVESALIGSGQSTYRALGAPPRRAGWRINLDPADGSSLRPRVQWLRNGALSTSGRGPAAGDHAAPGEAGHIFDPRHGLPATAFSRVTALADDATEADMLSTALFVAGSVAAPALLERFPGSAALLYPGAGSSQGPQELRWPDEDRASSELQRA